jgi:two-component system nitrogen regulation sensor histidine kinase NtrY
LKLVIALTLLLAAAGSMAALLTITWRSWYAAAAVVAVVGIVPAFFLGRAILRPVRRLLRGLTSAVTSYREGDFNRSFRESGNDEFSELLSACNELGRALREQRANLAQRELLLDTAIQHSPMALVLVDAQQRVVYENAAARHLLNRGRSLRSLEFEALVRNACGQSHAAAISAGDTLLTADIDGIEETFQVSRRSFLLQGRRHQLHLFKRLTRELGRQEASAWKKLIRVLSHEINNSLAPLASMADSGAELVRRGDIGRLASIFMAMGERAEHLHRFISGYAEFARLPAPQVGEVNWRQLADDLALSYRYRLIEPLPPDPGSFDRSQLEQALINLLKNAHESGGPDEEVEVAITQNEREQRIEGRDRGPGMTDVVLSQALLPFYSTKRTGTGLGLALAREIAEAHGGWIRLANREGGGLCVTLCLPVPRR